MYNIVKEIEVSQFVQIILLIYLQVCVITINATNINHLYNLSHFNECKINVCQYICVYVSMYVYVSSVKLGKCMPRCAHVRQKLFSEHRLSSTSCFALAIISIECE